MVESRFLRGDGVIDMESGCVDLARTCYPSYTINCPKATQSPPSAPHSHKSDPLQRGIVNQWEVSTSLVTANGSHITSFIHPQESHLPL